MNRLKNPDIIIDSGVEKESKRILIFFLLKSKAKEIINKYKPQNFAKIIDSSI